MGPRLGGSLAGPYLVAVARYHEAAVLIALRSRRPAARALAEAGRIAATLGAAPLHDAVATLAHRSRTRRASRPYRIRSA
jgi:hypothetical protein